MFEFKLKFRRSFPTLLGFLALAILAPGHAGATALLPGMSYQFEDHSGENHADEFLDGIDLSFGSFANSNLRKSSLIAGVFVQTNFSDTNLRDVSLLNADLTDAIFSPGTILRDADLSGATLIGIDLTGVNVQNAIFIGATYDFTTVLPFDPVDKGMILVPELSPMTLMLLGLLMMPVLGRRQYENRPSTPAAI
jgi:hypothetical protein